MQHDHVGSSGLRRRDFLATGVAAAGALAFGPSVLRGALAHATTAGPGPYGELVPSPDVADLWLPQGFRGREIARGGQVVGGYPWHFAPDGQATYATSDGGFILVSNSEAPAPTGGGASAIRFDANGEIVRAYRILGGTNLNCAGGPTPWGTWLSCEEHEGGMVWECDPAGVLPAQPRPALGNFSHEAAAVDPERKHVYLTEDQSDSGFYRFTPSVYPSLAAGLLEVAVVGADGIVTWKRVPDPNIVTAGKPVRQQVPEMTRFRGGEGLWYDRGVVYFTTKGDKRVWAYHTADQRLEVLYDDDTTPGSSLDAVDNITVAQSGDIYVCEDGGNMEICLITPDGVVAPFCRLQGPNHAGSEMCGVVFDPSGTRIYFSSQRAHPYVAGTPLAQGAVYEISGPFRTDAGAAPVGGAFGPPAGEAGGFPEASPGIALRTLRRIRLRALAARGLRVAVQLDEPGTLRLALRTFDLTRERRSDGTHDRPRPVTLARTVRRLPAGRHTVLLRPSQRALARTRGRRSLDASVVGAVQGRDGVTRSAARQIRLVR
jgi:uncharacterized protein